MNYREIYDRLIKRGQIRGLDKKNLDYYTESHHIIPKSMGGPDDIHNRVLLTAREHFIAHMLLVKIYNNPSMHFALWRMCNGKKADFKIHSRFYESARIKYSINMSLLNKGRITTDAHKLNLSKALKGRKSHTEGAPLKAETRHKISQSLKGKIQSVESLKKRSESQKGIPKPLFPACPHCGKVTSKSLALRWHYDNCKQHKRNING